jgi:hypothetical protein
MDDPRNHNLLIYGVDLDDWWKKHQTYPKLLAPTGRLMEMDWLPGIFVLLRLHWFVHECVSYTEYSVNYRPLQIFVFERDDQLRKYRLVDSGPERRVKGYPSQQLVVPKAARLTGRGGKSTVYQPRDLRHRRKMAVFELLFGKRAPLWMLGSKDQVLCA